MSLIFPNFGGTITGGTSLTFRPATITGNKSIFLAPNHTRLAAREVDFIVSNAKTTPSDPGVARASAKILLSNRDAQEGCCGVVAGSVIIDVGIRWSLSQDEALVDDALKYLQSLAFSQELRDAIIAAVLPQ